ncbi:hypothetical protein Tco_0191103, partial [Tanacetum coccineum]
LYPRIYALETCKFVKVGTKLTQSSLDFSFRRKPRGGIEQEQYEALLVQVQDVNLVPVSDRWKWSLENSGDFSVASVRKTRWIKLVPIKVNVHAWKVKIDSLPTRFNISRRVDVDVAECEAKDLLHVEVQDVTAHIIGVNTVVSSSFNVEYDIKLDASKDQVEDAKVEGNNNDIHKTCDKQPTTLDNSMDLGCHSISRNRIGKNRKMSPRGSCVWDVKMSERSKSKTMRSRSFNLAKLVVKRRRKRSPLDSNCDVLLDEYKVEHVCNASSDGGRR